VIDEAQLHAEIESAGDRTIVFLPGLLGSTSYWKAAKLEQWGQGARLIYLDELGFGRSPWPEIDYTLDDHLGAIRRTLEAHGATSRVSIAGHSFGTILAAHYADRYPNEVEALYLFGTPAYAGEADARSHVGAMSGLAGLLVKSRPLARVVCAVHNGLMPLSFRLAPYMRKDVPREVASDGALHFWPSLVGSVYNVILTKPIEVPLRSYRGEVTFIHTPDDEVTEIARIRSLADEIGATLIESSGTHASYWRTAEETLEGADRGAGRQN
jgi:pimeloyl-ACP methyl ester carboxylesterase